MKRLFYFFFIIPFLNYAQSPIYLPTKDDKVLFESVDTSSLTKNLLYSNAKVWYVNTFNDSKYVLEVDDRENGIIMGKGILSTQGSQASGYPYKFDIYFTTRIDLKDYKFRIQCYDLSIGFSSSPGKTLISDLKKDSGINADIIRSIEFVMNNFKNAVIKPRDDF